jgi:hypothetical protein
MPFLKNENHDHDHDHDQDQLNFHNLVDQMSTRALMDIQSWGFSLTSYFQNFVIFGLVQKERAHPRKNDIFTKMQ